MNRSLKNLSTLPSEQSILTYHNMNPSSGLLLYIAISFLEYSYASTLVLPTTSNESSIELNSSTVGLNLHCFDMQVFKRRRTKIVDCARALTKLPYYHLPGEFHNHGLADIFSLPYIVRYDRCQVSIKIDDYSGWASSSWLAIHAAAHDIIFGCPYDYSQTAETGGELLVGTPDRINITVERVRSYGLADGNANLTSTE